MKKNAFIALTFSIFVISACSKKENANLTTLNVLSEKEALNLAPQDFINYLDLVSQKQRENFIYQKLKLTTTTISKKKTSNLATNSSSDVSESDLIINPNYVRLDPSSPVLSLEDHFGGDGSTYKWNVVRSLVGWKVIATGEYSLSNDSPKKILSLDHLGTQTSGLSMGLSWSEGYGRTGISELKYSGYHEVGGTVSHVIWDKDIENVCYVTP